MSKKQDLHQAGLKRFQGITAVGYIVSLVLMLFMAGSNYYNINAMNQLMNKIISENNRKTEVINEMRFIARERLLLLFRIVDENDAINQDSLIIRHSNLAGEFIKHMEILSHLIESEQEKAIFQKLRNVLNQAQPAQREVVNFINQVDSGTLSANLIRASETQQGVIRELDDLMNVQKQNNRKLNQDITLYIENSYLWPGVISSFVIIVGSLISLMVFRFVTRQHKYLRSYTDALKESNYQFKKATKEAEKANRTKMEFIANMSHELRTPMTSIKGALGMLGSGMIRDLPEDAKELITIADANSDRLIGLITDVLDFSKIESGELELVYEDVELKKEINRFVAPYALKAKTKNIDLKIYFDVNLPDRMRTDVHHIKQILRQLLNNALKFTQAGVIEISIGVNENMKLTISVKDTGIGISEDKISELFESFVQGDGSSTRKYGGTGLGLAICKRLVDALKGEIGVQTKLGEGTTFYFSIPVEVQQKAA